MASSEVPHRAGSEVPHRAGSGASPVTSSIAPSFAQIAALAQREDTVVLVTVANVRGSVPRDAGTTMLVGRDSVVGTVGGGHLEFEAIRLSRAALADGGMAPWIVRFPLAARLGQCCGGVVTLAFEVIDHGAAWIEAAADAERSHVPCAVVACLGRNGHVVMTAKSTSGTLGDAALDAQATRVAADRLAAHDSAASSGPHLVELTSPSAHTLLVRVAAASSFTVLVFGNGHVGRALVQMLAAVPARVRWIDARETDFPASVPDAVETIATDTPESELAGAPPGACVVIATHDHSLDYRLLTAALERDDWTYLGLIGSRSKRQQFERRLLERGHTQAQLARIVCPIGRSETVSLRSKEPGTIALATAAEIVAARDRARCISSSQDRSRQHS